MDDLLLSRTRSRVSTYQKVSRMRWRFFVNSSLVTMRFDRRYWRYFKRSSMLCGPSGATLLWRNACMSTVGSELDDQSSQIHIMTERSEIGIAYAGFDTQWFQINCGSHLFSATGDEKIRHMFENIRDQQSAKTNQGTSALWLAEGSMESTALLNVDLCDGVHDRLKTKSSLMFNHRKGTTHRL